MDALFGLRGQDFVLVAFDTSVAQSILKVKLDEDKTFALDDCVLLAMAGDAADRGRFGAFLTRNIHFLRFKHGTSLGVHETAEFIRTRVAENLRKGGVQTDALVAGWSEREGARLYWLDNLGTLAEVPHGAHGYAAYFVSSILANLWRPGLSLDEAVAVARQCVAELRTRFIIDQAQFVLKVVDKNGITVIS